MLSKLAQCNRHKVPLVVPRWCMVIDVIEVSKGENEHAKDELISLYDFPDQDC